jgi:hypothetical protein
LEICFIITKAHVHPNTALLSNPSSENLKFILDSGATDHLVSEQTRNVMCNIEKLNAEIEIKIANGERVTAREKGQIRAYVGNPAKLVTFSALIVPDITFNLLSVRKINSEMGARSR